jgi:hypothetical protein
MTYREPAPKGKNKLKKYEGEELYQEGIVKTTVKQSRRVESRGRRGLEMSRRTDTDRQMDAAECCKFAFNILCSKEDGLYYLSNRGSGIYHHHHPKNDNIVNSASTMDEETMRIIKKCAKVNTVPSQVRCLTHQMTGQNFTTDQISNMYDKATEDKLLDDQDLLNPEKRSSSASRILNHLEMIKIHFFYSLVTRSRFTAF